jgi:hypothetical protein
LQPRARRVALLVIAAILVVGAFAWYNRWHLSRTAIRIADPLVRAWAAHQVLQGSDSAYRLVASPIIVDAAHRRITIDTITVTTDTAANNRLPRPHAVVTMRFRHCGLTGIDLTALAAGGGLHALHAGCDSVSLAMRTIVPPIDTVTGPQPADSNNFLRFQGQVDLPAVLPHIAVDALEFPHMHVALDLLASDGRRTSLTVDSIALSLDSIYIDPAQPVTQRRPLFAHDITVRLDRFEGITRSSAHIGLRHLRANLEDGTATFDDVLYETAPKPHGDSAGFARLRLQHLHLSGVYWRSFLLAGDVIVGALDVDTVSLRTIHAVKPPHTHSHHEAPPSLEAGLRSIGHLVILDSMILKSTTITQVAVTHRDSAVTTVRRVTVGHAAFAPDASRWNTPFPLGHLTLAIDGLLRRTPRMNVAVGRVWLAADSSHLVFDSLHAAPPGNDSAWQAINPYRKARLSVTMRRVDLRGIDLQAFARHGDLRARAIEVGGMIIDVLKDKNKPEDPAPKVVRRTPEDALRDVGAVIQVDTVLGQGLVTYRERAAGAPSPGILSFGAIRVRGYNFSTDPRRMNDAHPFRLIGDTKLMGAGAMHVEWDVPLLSRDLSMHWHGSLGRMNPEAMNGFLPNSVGMRFAGGTFDGATWQASVTHGLASGTLAPRWHDLHVELPGVDRGDSGVVGGIVRGVAKLAANTFGIRADNDTIGGAQPIDGVINHQWINVEPLPLFIWLQLRAPLLGILKK